STLHVMVWASVANIVLTVLWASRWGIAGAAWASVATFGVFAMGGLLRYRKIDVYPYQFTLCGGVVSGMAASVLLCRIMPSLFGLSRIVAIALPGAVFGLWTLALAALVLRARARFTPIGLWSLARTQPDEATRS